MKFLVIIILTTTYGIILLIFQHFKIKMSFITFTLCKPIIRILITVIVTINITVIVIIIICPFALMLLIPLQSSSLSHHDHHHIIIIIIVIISTTVILIHFYNDCNKDINDIHNNILYYRNYNKYKFILKYRRVNTPSKSSERVLRFSELSYVKLSYFDTQK